MNYKRNAILVASLGIFGPFCSLASAEADLAVVPYVEAGYSHYTLEFRGNIALPNGTSVPGNNKFIFDSPVAKAGLAAAYGDFSGNIYYRDSGESNDIQDFPELPGVPSVKWDGERNDYGISVAYTFMDSFAVFGGYRDAETKGSGSFNSKFKLEEDGYFLGGSYRLALTDTGGLTFSLGYAWLDLKLNETLRTFVIPEIKGDGDGAKVEVVWRDFFNDHWGYSVSANYYEYDFDLDEVGGMRAQESTDLEETETTLNVGLFYVF